MIFRTLSMTATLLAATSAGASQPGREPLLGTWSLDLTSMPVPPDARPASVTVTFADGGAAGWSAAYVIAARDGSERRMTSRTPMDGAAVAIEGDRLEADSVALSHPARGVLVMGLSKEGRPGSVRVYTVAPDANTMTESAANVDADGKPFIRTFRWRRQTPAR